MDGEIGSYTVNGGWLIFLALAALWIALTIEARSRRLSSLLEAAIKEAEQLRAAGAKPACGTEVRQLGDGLEQLASAVEGEGKGAAVEQAEVQAVRHIGRES